MTPGSILLLDDDPDVLYTARMVLKQQYGEVHTERDPAKLTELLRTRHYDVILLDMNFSPGVTSGKEGLHWLRQIRQLDPAAQVVMCTAYGDIQLAVAAMKEGAIDFLVKPWEKEKLLATVRAVFQLSQSAKEVSSLRSRQKVLHQALEEPYAEMISVSAAMRVVEATIAKVAPTEANVLILGENGTGKELVARALHRLSDRAGEVFIKVDLGAISESLFESELFGHVKGAFTDAREDRPGRFEIASGGTLFLDEIGNLSLPLQAKLLTALQSRQVTRLGSNKPLPLDIRLISATNQPLHQMVAAGTFRQDLLYRLNTVEISLPPLREREEDIPLLARHYLGGYGRKYQKGEVQLSREALRSLQKYAWPGNIRELQHALERAVILADKPLLQPADFALSPTPAKARSRDTLNLEALEKVAIQQAIQKHGGNLSKAAEELGFGRSTLYRKLTKYDL
jgi:two-component system response regulator HydG